MVFTVQCFTRAIIIYMVIHASSFMFHLYTALLCVTFVCVCNAVYHSALFLKVIHLQNLTIEMVSHMLSRERQQSYRILIYISMSSRRPHTPRQYYHKFLDPHLGSPWNGGQEGQECYRLTIKRKLILNYNHSFLPGVFYSFFIIHMQQCFEFMQEHHFCSYSSSQP